MSSVEANPGDPEDSHTATFVKWSPLESRFAVGSGGHNSFAIPSLKRT